MFSMVSGLNVVAAGHSQFAFAPVTVHSHPVAEGFGVAHPLQRHFRWSRLNSVRSWHC